MNFLADECCDTALVEKMRNAGHDVLYVMESDRGSDDIEILHRAFNENRILITEDKDFGDLVYRLKLSARGIILMRFSSEKRRQKWNRLKVLLHQKQAKLYNCFTVVDSEKFRIRPLFTKKS